MSTPRLSVGAVASAHGVRGQFKVKPFTATPRDIAAYGPVWAGDRQLTLQIRGMTANGYVIVAAEGVTDRNAAEALRGTELQVERSALPDAADDEVYHADLIGLPAEMPDGSVIGPIIGLHNFGAGELVELRPSGGSSLLLPFGGDNIVEIDLEGGRVVLDPPAEFLDSDDTTEKE